MTATIEVLLCGAWGDAKRYRALGINDRTQACRTAWTTTS
jgi:hypothetical protein